MHSDTRKKLAALRRLNAATLSEQELLEALREESFLIGKLHRPQKEAGRRPKASRVYSPFLNELYKRYFPFWVLWAARLTSRSLDISAEDIVQEAFLKLMFVTPERLTSVKNFRAYMAQMIRNLFFDHLRRRRVYLQRGTDFLALYDVPAPESTSQEELLAHLDLAIEGLNKREKFIIESHVFKGKTLKEIANDLGVHPPSIYVIYSRIIGKLKNSLEKQGIL